MVGPVRTRVVIIGAGFGGIGLGIRPKQAGGTRFGILEEAGGGGGLGRGARPRQAGGADFVILEKSEGVGGVWRQNSYPGAACDVPSHLYSFSFAPDGRWSKRFAEQREIHAYLQRVARDHGVLPHV